ncbi:MAG: ABC transporter substrate-binding protein [Bacteroidales bacterium]|mgnify:CR=1 FL=1|nr:ABC transporter substrate-binding protein [Bacteroidales bacterium]MDD4669826.1 ABC transporter substrate-binding protein [Bacteroidales bacterium]
MKNFFANLVLLTILSCIPMGAQDKLHKITFSPSWMPQAQFAGYYVALEKGFYRDAGLDVEIIIPSNSSPSVLKLKTGEVDIISTQLVQAIAAKDAGTDLVNICQTSQVNGLVIVAQPQYTSLEDLIGKRVASWKSGFSELAYCMANDNGHNVEWIDIPSGINYFISGAVDGILTMYYNEYFQVMNCGKKVTEQNVFHLSEYGYNVPEDGLYCLRSAYLNHEKEMNAFAQASKRGWEYAREHTDETIDIVIKTMKIHNIASSPSHQKWMLAKILELQINKETGQASYTLDPKTFKFAVDVLKKNNLIKNDVTYDSFVSPETRVK